jgi:similar to spore coat protein
MNGFIEKLTGMAPLTDQVIATDLLMASKTAVRNYSLAITETATPEIRETLTNQLEDAIDTHRKISVYMIEKGYYHPLDTKKQLEVDLRIAETAMSIAND